MTGWTIGWLAWIGWFAVEEGLALWRGGTSATLSGHVWRWFATAPDSKGPLVSARRLILMAGLLWLAVHFLTGGQYP